MARMIKKNTTIATIAIQAPARNLVTSTITKTTAVMASPKVLIARERYIRRRTAGFRSVRRWRDQCRIMPSWLRLKETKTPTM